MNQYSFENFIMNCCKAREWNLRKWLKATLSKNGFRIVEDDYLSRRGSKYNNVHNMLAIRGNPEMCLVAHTDVCRDHFLSGTPDVFPVIKEQHGKKIIQDRDCETQVGGDDRLGVAINTWIALNTGYDLGLLFTTDEEIGVVSANRVNFSELLDCELLVQVDRGNHSNQIVNNIGGCQLCSDDILQELLQISKDIGLPRVRTNGLLTDVLAIKENNMCKNAINMTCGYWNSFGAQPNEYIDIQEARDTMKFVANIIKYYSLKEKSDTFTSLGDEYMTLQDRDYDLFSERAYMMEKGYY